MRPARHDPLLSGLNPAAAAFEFAVVWLTLAGFALTATPVHISREDWLTFAILVPIIAAVHLLGAERQKHQGSHLVGMAMGERQGDLSARTAANHNRRLGSLEID